MDQYIERTKLAQFGSIELLAKQVVEGFITGLHKSPFHGFSVEFAEHRLYNQGESTRHVDWKLFARTEKLFTKKYEEETNLRCQMVLDISSSMLYSPENQEITKLEFSVYAIASIMELLKRQRDAIGLSLFSDTLELHTEAKSSVRHQRYILSELEKQMQEYTPKATKQSNPAKALHDIAELCHKRSLVILFTDMLEDPTKKDQLFEALQHLRHNRHEVIVFHVVDQSSEIHLELENRPYTFVDMETGEKLKLHPAQMKEQYQNAAKAYFKEIENKCRQYRIDFMQLDIEQPLAAVLQKYLIKRQKMK